MQPVLRTVTKVRCEGWILSVLLLGSCGCANFMDTVTSRDFKMKDLWSKPPDPDTVLRESSDGAKRGQALANMKEPLTHGGTQDQQEKYIKILVQAATRNPPVRSLDPHNPYPEGTDPDCLEPLVRLGAIRALGEYKDPRAAAALREVFEGPLPFLPEMNSKIKLQALTALEKTGSATARALFIIFAPSPGPGRKSSVEDQNLSNDERLAALRGLARFHDQEVLNTLVSVLESEKNIALRDRAHESLKTITGKNLPQDAAKWHALIQNSPPDAFAHQPSKLLQLVQWIGP